MAKTNKTPSRFWAYVSVAVGGLLVLTGIGAATGYMGLPSILADTDIFGAQLGQVAALFLGLGGGSLALFHGLGSLRGEASRPFRLPPLHFFVIAFALVIGLGNVLLTFDVVVNYLFPFLFLLGAALPSLAVLAWAGQRLGWPITWRQASLSFVSGATLSILVTLILGLILASVFFVLVMPVELLAGSLEGLMDLFGRGFLERFFFSPYVIVLIFITALQAPIPEEFAKALGPGFMLNRISNERQAFMLGLASGAGFAILENMLYEGVYALWSDWTWGGVTLLRAFGAVLHPLTTGIVVVALFRNRRRQRGWFGRIAGAYLLAVLLHTLWNGGFEALLFMTGIDHYSGIGPAFNVYGESIAVFLVIYLVLFSAALWWLLVRIVRGLAGDVDQEIAPTIVSVRSVALWAAVSLLVILPIGTAIGPAWGGATDVFAAGPPPTATPTITPTSSPSPTPYPTAAPTMTPILTSTPLPKLAVGVLPEARIAFQSRRGGIPVIYLLEGENLRPLTASYDSNRNPSWSPDGREIVFQSDPVSDKPEIYVINIESEIVRQLTDQQGTDSHPAWSPDGEHIVFVSWRDGLPQLYLMNADGSDQIRLTDDALPKTDPSWSPDGRYITYAAGEIGKLDIYVLDVTFGVVTHLTNNDDDEKGPVFSPDGRQIAYSANYEHNIDIYLITIDSRDVIPLITSDAVDDSPSWSPDGKYLAFSSTLDSARDIYALEINTRKVIRLTDQVSSDYAPAWSP